MLWWLFLSLHFNVYCITSPNLREVGFMTWGNLLRWVVHLFPSTIRGRSKGDKTSGSFKRQCDLLGVPKKDARFEKSSFLDSSVHGIDLNYVSSRLLGKYCLLKWLLMLKRNQLIIEAKMLPSPGNELHLTALAQGSYLQQGLPFYSTVRQVTDWAVVEELQQ